MIAGAWRLALHAAVCWTWWHTGELFGADRWIIGSFWTAAAAGLSAVAFGVFICDRERLATTKAEFRYVTRQRDIAWRDIEQYRRMIRTIPPGARRRPRPAGPAPVPNAAPPPGPRNPRTAAIIAISIATWPGQRPTDLADYGAATSALPAIPDPLALPAPTDAEAPT